MILRVTPFGEPDDLDARLDAAGLAAFDDTRVMWLPRLDAIAEPASFPLRAVSGDEYALAVGDLRGTLPDRVEAHAVRLRLSPVPYRGFVHERDGRIVACGQFALEGTIVGLYDVFTVPRARGRGLSRRLCAHLLAQAHAQGARVAYLQVDVANIAAHAVYRRLGFSEAYHYHYRALPSVDE